MNLRRFRPAIVLLGAVLIAAALPAAADPAEAGASSRVSLYQDDDATTVVTTAVRGTMPLGTVGAVRAAWIADVVTSASVDVVTAATRAIHERRDELRESADYHYREALKLDPASLAARIDLAENLLYFGKYSDATDELEIALRVAVQPGGCSGLRYSMYLDDQVTDKDQTAEQHGVRLVIDKMSVPYLSQATVDFIDSLEQSGFTIDNPAAQGGCACGHSFS